jgi:hypothetical protein
MAREGYEELARSGQLCRSSVRISSPETTPEAACDRAIQGGLSSDIDSGARGKGSFAIQPATPGIMNLRMSFYVLDTPYIPLRYSLDESWLRMKKIKKAQKRLK